MLGAQLLKAIANEDYQQSDIFSLAIRLTLKEHMEELKNEKTKHEAEQRQESVQSDSQQHQEN